MNYKSSKIESIRGTLRLSGDKSVSHRAVMFSSMAAGDSIIRNCLLGQDIISTINCFRSLGCEIGIEGTDVRVKGRGYKAFRAPANNLDCGNSGTTARLIAGILAGQNFKSILVGDESLSRRPMLRIINPLIGMNADIIASDTGTLPLRISPAENMKPIEYHLPVASAQVKSAVLLAGLFLDEKTTVIEKIRSRNHTEIMLNLETEEKNGILKIYSSKKNYPESGEYHVPADISTASFFIVLCLLSKNSELILKDVLLNPTRIGVLNVLKKMGGDIEFLNESSSSRELYGDLLVRSSKLTNINIDENIIPNIIDEIPILAVAGAKADGDFEIQHAQELRKKESDRIASLCANFRILGFNTEEFPDGFKVSGKVKNINTEVDSFGDHRIAMAFAILGCISDIQFNIKNFECTAVSNPDFENQLKSVAAY